MPEAVVSEELRSPFTRNRQTWIGGVPGIGNSIQVRAYFATRNWLPTIETDGGPEIEMKISQWSQRTCWGERVVIVLNWLSTPQSLMQAPRPLRVIVGKSGRFVVAGVQ